MRIGEALAEARRQAGLTVAEVGERTRIRETIIRGIERDDYSVCGGDFYARGHIRAVARAVGTDPEPLIREYDAAHRAPGALSAVSMEELLTTSSPPPRRRPPWAALLGLVVAVTLGFVVYDLLSSPGSAPRSVPAAARHATAHRHTPRRHPATAAGRSARPSVTPSPHRAVPVRVLTPASVTAFGAGGAGQGDNPELARLAVDADPATAWHTDWYTTARFGNLYPGTGLLLDLGRPVRITEARIRLGSAPGATVQLRAGGAPSLADLRPVAHADNASGAVPLPLATPVRARYVLIWFTRLPPDPNGTFQVSMYGVSLRGRG